MVWCKPDAAMFCMSLEPSMDFPSQFLALDLAIYQKSKVREYTDIECIESIQFLALDLVIYQKSQVREYRAIFQKSKVREYIDTNKMSGRKC